MSSTSTPGMHLQNFILDPSSTPDQKAECLKLVKVVIRNLSDPVKAQNDKYRKLRLENETIRAKLVPHEYALEYLKAIGFVEQRLDGERILYCASPNLVVMQSSLVEVTNALQMVQPTTTASSNGTMSRSGSTLTSRSSSGSLNDEKKSEYDYIPKLSEKQKARKLLEKKQQEEKLRDKEARKRNLAQLQQDKYVRQNDPNWKSGVSAACAKSGTGISTFRDKYGEH